MDQEIYIINPGKKALKNFIENSQSAIDDIEERLSLKKTSDPAYLRKLGEQYRVLSVYYNKGKPIDFEFEPKKYRVKDFKKAYDTIKRELDNFDLYITMCISRIRGILEQLASFDEDERERFNKKFYIDERDSSKISDEAIDDFLPRFKKRFGDLTLDDSPFFQLIETEIEEKITEHKDALLHRFRKEIEGNIVKDLFRHIIIYTKTLKEIIEVIRNSTERPGANIRGKPWDAEEAAIKEVLHVEFEDVQKDSLSNYHKQLEDLSREEAENFKRSYLLQLNNGIKARENETLRAIEERRETAVAMIARQQSDLEAQLTQYQKTLITTIEDRYKELENRIIQRTNDTVNTIKNYQKQANDSINDQKQQYTQSLKKEAEESILELEQTRETVVRQFSEELQKKITETSHKLEHLERREYEIIENLRNVSQFIQYHPELNTSLIEYWKSLLAFAFKLHTEVKDTSIPEPAKTVWLNGINQTLGALLTVTHDRLAERAMREGSKYRKIPTTESDCQKVWGRFVAYIGNPRFEDTEYLMRRMDAFAKDQTLKNVALPAVLYKLALLEFDKNYHSINAERDKSYENKKHYFKAFFTIAYDEMIERFRRLIMNMAV